MNTPPVRPQERAGGCRWAAGAGARGDQRETVWLSDVKRTQGERPPLQGGVEEVGLACFYFDLTRYE